MTIVMAQAPQDPIKEWPLHGIPVNQHVARRVDE
jgi:hypothetical protein